MRKAIKNQGKILTAYRLGDGSETEMRLLEEGKLRRMPDGNYEVFSLEVKNGSGEIAAVGDYIKLSSDGWPYPNDKAFFAANHRRIEGDTYEQIPKPLDAWTAEDGMVPEIAYLIAERGLVIDEKDEEKYFSAPLWGTTLSAARDAVIVFYQVKRDEHGKITNADFNFVAKNEFDRTYSWENTSEAE
ncbi:MAG: hypothetical protein IKU40_03840 [Clostridia bacterium]|nr:hypothetical protein [Clostridia bacterium]